MKTLDKARGLLSASTRSRVSPDLNSPAAAYRWMLSVRDGHRRRAELEALTRNPADSQAGNAIGLPVLPYQKAFAAFRMPLINTRVIPSHRSP